MQEDINIAAYIGHEPALDFLELQARPTLGNPENIDELLEQLDEYDPEAPTRAMLALAQDAIDTEEQKSKNEKLLRIGELFWIWPSPIS